MPERKGTITTELASSTEPFTATALAADVGGTFTDIVALDERSGEVLIGKSPTVTESPAEGIVKALEHAGVAIEDGQRLFHGTTVGVNALLQRRGSVVGLITTRGFRDVLEIGRASWPPYRMSWQRPAPLVSRALTREIAERIRADGTVLLEPDLDEVGVVVEELVAAGVQAIAVCLINSYAYPEHEQRIGEFIRQARPELVVVLSHEMSRRYHEFERTLTTVGEAYLRPQMRRYFEELGRGLSANGFDGTLFITSSDGGVMGEAEASTRALRTLVSGCASGVAGAAAVGETCGWRNLITIDMGGTSFDAALIHEGQPVMSATSEVSGFEFLLPMIEMTTIAAGGGSIAAIDESGGLTVGPESASASPGPACYERGGTEPTFTDAALVSGLLPENLLGGEMRLSKSAALAALDSRIATPMGMDPLDAASGIVVLSESKMASAVEEITIGKGFDPRDFVLFAYGGAGPLVANVIARSLGIREVVVPRHPGAFSAWGMQTLDVVHEFGLTALRGLDESTHQQLMDPFVGLVAEADAALGREHVPASERSMRRFLELRFDAQEHTLLLPVDAEDAGLDDPVGLLAERFRARHEAAYGFTLDAKIDVVGYRLRAVGKLPKNPVLSNTNGADRAAAPVTTRLVTHRESGAQEDEWPVYRREDLPPEQRLAGPAIVEERTATTLVLPGWTARVDRWLNLVLRATGMEDA